MKILSDEKIASLRRHPRIYRIARSARFVIGRLAPSFALPGVPGHVHANDFMLRSTDQAAIESYVKSARDALAVLDSALRTAGRRREDVRQWLDFGCGYGRILRFLLEQVPADRVWVTDVLPDAVRFCSREFKVRSLDELAEHHELLGTFDVIYAISVFTHLPADRTERLAGLLTSALAPSGLLIFTTHGPWSLDASSCYPTEFMGKREEIEANLTRSGIHFMPYSYSRDGTYGLTWETPEFVTDLFARHSRVEQLLFQKKGLESFQDVYVYRAVSRCTTCDENPR